MTTGVQASLFDAIDHTAPTGAASSSLGRLDAGVVHHRLTRGAWVDVRPGWVSGSLAVFDALRTDVPWRAEQRQMYERMLPVPRLLSFYDRGAPLPHPLLARARDELSRHYRACLPEGFATSGLALYRDGADSVAWHGDRIGRSRDTDTLIAIVSLGSPRTLLMRPRGGGSSRKFVLGSGDLLVMGGSCQRTWDHAVPKAAGAGPRISVQFRPHGVR
ncbi:alpha-ketoglutarate-dependent dioxygenase AlkB [Gordonia sp. (in: high G+C Gram-positive bacteria)]|uniref:alpha-ketoglutarate-dependent dioxygenase AlkB n=1 Tax=Gordonia sp. (in: high G+C Gram-positive bacteria) TaxID=84139 RepID=UPI0016969F8A|nr:alpha-ketoglutarate-dependent dioxygenase AlkB [Gordonia sp. (in: high G+C Gram-positive bacteria)]NLG46868.1 alpha-ketoglutarate-dependent dioxygenase AlkB [Gordonia sp. (in: high G+C Gram-positive bacteria)]